MINIAIVGLGYWGPNLLRTFVNVPGCSVTHCCDLDTSALNEAKRKFPHVTTTTNYDEIIANSDINAIVLATPTKTHYLLAKKALKSGKDVLVEKPIASNSKEAWELVKIAEKYKRIIMVDHILLFNPAVIKIKELIDKGEIG